jgi:thioesterase domain-containing protein/peptidoglycan/xylan/chitin deacetylase (PgdA/CDA1 family)
MEENGRRLLCGTPELPPRCVALTFDDGPGPRSAELARLLRDENVPGTFFVLGESVRQHGNVLETYRDCGHAIGLHGDRHRPFESAGHAAAELTASAELVGDYLVGTPWFRPPYGIGDWPVPGFAGPVGWHAQGQDWDITYRHGQTVQACVEAVMKGLHSSDGGIVLLHDFAAATEFIPAGLTEDDLDLRIVEIVTLLIERLRGAGFSFVPLPSPPRAALSEPSAQAEPAVPVRGSGLGRLGAADDMKTLRLFRAVAKAAGGALDLLMPLREDGDGPALFCVHPLVGLSWCYLAMLPYVDARYPMYGLQARGLRRPEPLPASMAEMARDYADQIRLTQPAGPYHLLGWSLGGNIAFAIAEELQRRGERVELLVIMDANIADFGSIERGTEPWMIYNLVLAQFGYVPALTPADPDAEARMLELVRRRPGLGLERWPERRLRALQRVINNNLEVGRGYQPGVLDCSLLFVSASRNGPTLAEKLESWKPFVSGPVEAVEVDSDHRQMLLPEPMTKLGPVLSERMARAALALKSPIV